jgi:conjugative transfer region protein (TIGR03750 family)
MANEMSNWNENADFLADRTNAEPVIFRGVTSTEMLYMLVGGIVIWTPFSLVIGFVIRRPMFALIFIMLLVIGTVYFGSIYLSSLKRNRPDHYYVQMAQIKLARLGIGKHPFFQRSGYWALDRRYEPLQKK